MIMNENQNFSRNAKRKAKRMLILSKNLITPIKKIQTAKKNEKRNIGLF